MVTDSRPQDDQSAWDSFKNLLDDVTFDQLPDTPSAPVPSPDAQTTAPDDVPTMTPLQVAWYRIFYHFEPTCRVQEIFTKAKETGLKFELDSETLLTLIMGYQSYLMEAQVKEHTFGWPLP